MWCLFNEMFQISCSIGWYSPSYTCSCSMDHALSMYMHMYMDYSMYMYMHVEDLLIGIVLNFRSRSHKRSTGQTYRRRCAHSVVVITSAKRHCSGTQSRDVMCAQYTSCVLSRVFANGLLNMYNDEDVVAAWKLVTRKLFQTYWNWRRSLLVEF